MMNSFWWDSNNQQRRDINLLSWDKITMKKEFGGIGLRQLHALILSC